MTIAQFISRATVEEFNTNNGWGFGGSIGREYTYDRLTIRRGRYCYRHAPSEAYTSYYERDGGQVTEREFEQLIAEL